MQQLARDPKIYYAILDSDNGYLAICVAEDCEVVYTYRTPDRARAKYALTSWSQWDCKNKYPKGFTKVDLTHMNTDQLAQHAHFMRAMRL